MSETQRSFKDEIRRRLARLGLPPERETDIVDELAQHLEARHADLVRAGRPEAEAYRIVVAEIGGHEAWAQLSERRPPEPIPLGDGGSGLTLSHVWRDVRFGARMLRRHPGFTAVAALTLALGIGANTAIFTVVNAVMLRPLPFADPDRLVNVYENNLSRGWPAFGVSHPNFLDWRDTAKSFDRLAAWRGQSFSVTSGGAAELVDGAGVTDGFFPLLGVTPALGRNFLPEEDRPGGRRAAILGHGFWLRRFGGDPSAVGRTLTLTDDTYVIVGVLPRTFRWSGAEVYVPLAPDPQRGRGDHRLNVMGRLRPGVTVEQARGEMVAIARGLEQSYPDTNRGWSVALEPIFDAAVPEQIRRALLLLLAAAALVLLIATSNVANLSLARAAARQREIAIRVALGAQRKRIVAQLLVESSLLALGAGLVGLLIAVLATQALRAGASGIPRMDEISIDARVVGFALLVSSAAAVLFGVIPALQAARPSPHGSLALTDGRGGGARVRGRLRDAIVVAEVALSVALLSGAGLLVRSFALLHDVPTGFEPTNVLTMRIEVSAARHPSGPQAWGFYDRVLTQLRAHPGVLGAAVASLVPMGDGGNTAGSLRVDGRGDPSGGQLPSTDWRIVSPGYFRALAIPLRGRDFDVGDREGAPRVTIVSEEAARRYWPGEDPIGKRVVVESFGREPATVIGVAGDVKSFRLDGPERPMVYMSAPAYAGWPRFSLVVRTQADPTAQVASIRAAVASIDPEVPLADVATAAELVDQSLGPRRFHMFLLGCFAAVALALACVGLFGVMGYLVSQRTREIGVRLALGARPRDIFALVVGHGLLLAGVGAAIGVTGALWLTRALESLLYGVTPTDPVALAGSVALLLTVSAVACYVPARRAMRVDPMEALRHE